MYELGFYIPEDAILHNHRHENLKSYLDDSHVVFGKKFHGEKGNVR
jgi:hypothetical protein